MIDLSLSESYMVYKNQFDFPQKFVVVKCVGIVPTSEPFAVVDTLQEARAAIPQGLYLVSRCENDDACLCETWI